MGAYVPIPETAELSEADLMGLTQRQARYLCMENGYKFLVTGTKGLKGPFISQKQLPRHVPGVVRFSVVLDKDKVVEACLEQ